MTRHPRSTEKNDILNKFIFFSQKSVKFAEQSEYFTETNVKLTEKSGKFRCERPNDKNRIIFTEKYVQNKKVKFLCGLYRLVYRSYIFE